MKNLYLLITLDSEGDISLAETYSTLEKAKKEASDGAELGDKNFILQLKAGKFVQVASGGYVEEIVWAK